MTTPPKKDVLYVDIEDDITSIIEKVKDASAPIVALVPPKRIGVLQSVVNLKLLQRAAETAKKRVVMITSDHALTALATSVAMPVAKNLQSKPEIAELPTAADETDDVIDGEEVAAADPAAGEGSDEMLDPLTPAIGSTALAAQAPSRKKTPVIPNFDRFRNNIFLYVGGAVLVLTLLIWAIFFAPQAHVTITAKTTPYSVSKPLTAAASQTLNASDGRLPAVVKEIKKTASADFTATGKKDVGEKATGTVNFSNASFDATTIAAGTTLTSAASGLTYVTNAAVTVPKGTCTSIFNCKPGTASGAVTASQGGSKYNADSGALSGAGSAITAAFAAPTSGGTDKTVTVVSEDDAAKARDTIKAEAADTIKAELQKQFSGEVVAVSESFTTTPGNPVVTPAVGQEATSGKVSVETTYRMIGVARADIRAIVEKDVQKQIAGLPNQSVYDLGLDKLRFTSYSQDADTYKLTAQTTSYVGPSIDAATLARKLSGKREGEIQQIIKTYEGIRSVEVKFAPFWVMTAPAPDKITIKFQIENANR